MDTRLSGEQFPTAENDILLCGYPRNPPGSRERSISTARRVDFPDSGSSRVSLLQRESHSHTSIEECDTAVQDRPSGESLRNELTASNDTSSPSMTWTPRTLRPGFLYLLGGSAILLSTIAALLCWISETQHGLGTDDGSSLLLLGWKFSPSLIAVLYVQLTAMLLDDVKRTEPFARLAKASGSRALWTVLNIPGAWWSALYDGLSTAPTKGRSWVLVCSATLNIIGFLAISPLSSAFLDSKDMPIKKEVDFWQASPIRNSPLLLHADRDVYLRTIAHVLQNTSTSAWISDQYTMLPFWPSSSTIQDTPLGPYLATSSQTWEAETLVMSNEMDCTPMKVEATSIKNVTYNFGVNDEFTGWDNMASLKLHSEDNCTFELTLSSFLGEISDYGGAQWSHSSQYLYSAWDYETGQNPVVHNSESGNIYLHSSKECGSRELLLITTPWFKDYVSALEPNTTFSPEFDVSCNICATRYYMANVTVEVRVSETLSEFSFQEEEFHSRRVQIGDSFLNTTELQDMMLSYNWSTFMKTPRQSSEVTENRALGGLSNLLGAMYDFNLTAMIRDDDIILQATKIKQRVFGELFQRSLFQGDTPKERLVGHLTIVERRVLVTVRAAIALAILLFGSFCLIILIWRLSDVRARPLNIQQDPATALGILSLVALNAKMQQGFRGLSQYTIKDMETRFDNKCFYTTPNTLHSEFEEECVTPGSRFQISSMRETRPNILKFRIISIFTFVLLAVATTIVFLNNQLSDRILYYTTPSHQWEYLGADIPVVGMISIASTSVAVGVGLWWGSIDGALRRLQPYVSMAEGPKVLSHGALLSYQSSYWAWAAMKAALKKQWFLCTITLGTSLCPILTMSMSALFYMEPSDIIHTTSLERGLKIRQSPFLYRFDVPQSTKGTYRIDIPAIKIISWLFSRLSTNWLHSSTIQLVLNGSQPSWSLNGWSFVPLDLSRIVHNDSYQGHEGRIPKDALLDESRLSVSTTAMKGRLECTVYQDLDTYSSWLELWDLSDSTMWNPPSDPQALEIGYGLRDAQWFANNFFNTSILNNPSKPECCANNSKTTSNTEGSAIGYWSPADARDFPFLDSTWPKNFTIKWIYGHLRGGYHRRNSSREYFLYADIPSVQALNCEPIFEVAEAYVTVSMKDGRVHAFEITEEPSTATAAWTAGFRQQGEAKSHKSEYNFYSEYNLAASYGVLFFDSLLGAAQVYDLHAPEQYEPWLRENLDDNTFNYRNPHVGLNLDFMTYSMYELANRDPRALLNATTMEALAQTTFSAFFQHFVSSNVSIETGSWAYEPINTTSLTNRTVDVEVATPAEVLKMNPVAVWLSIAILAWLMITALVVAAAIRSHLKGMLRDIECIADVLVIGCGSDKLLELIREEGMEGLQRRKDEIMVKLGHFEDSTGETRWGLELVDPGHESPRPTRS